MNTRNIVRLVLGILLALLGMDMLGIPFLSWIFPFGRTGFAVGILIVGIYMIIDATKS